MRVTGAVREYVRKAVLSKVADRLKEAEEAKEAAVAARDAKVEKAEELCRRICAEAQAKFAREAKKLGLTFIPDSYNSYTDKVTEGGNRAVVAAVGCDDFVETVARNSLAARHNPSAGRERFYEIVDEPKRIREAAEQAADRLLFELELGKIAKKEMDELLEKLEVEI